MSEKAMRELSRAGELDSIDMFVSDNYDADDAGPPPGDTTLKRVIGLVQRLRAERDEAQRRQFPVFDAAKIKRNHLMEAVYEAVAEQDFDSAAEIRKLVDSVTPKLAVREQAKGP